MSDTIINFKMSGCGAISLIDSRTGVSWFCAKGPTVRCWNVAEERIRELSADKLLINRTDGDSQIALDVSFPHEGISFRIEYAIKDSMLEVRVPIASIGEKNQGFRLLSISPLPGFGAVRTGEPGYMLLPNYSGAICRFDKDVSRTNGDIIYMQQSQWEHFTDLPVFGICHGDSAFFGIVASGEFDTEIVTELNKGSDRLNSIYPCLHFRYGKADEIDNIDRAVRYYFLAGSDANYAGMARTYRRYLLDERHLRPLRDRVKEEPALMDYDSYNFIKILCAVKDVQPDGQGDLQIKTTFAEAREILQSLRDAGIERASILLVGWNIDGHDGKYPTRFPAESLLGGDQGLKELIKHAKGLGYRIAFHDNYADGYRISKDFSEDDVMRDSDGWFIRGGTWAGGLSYIMCPHQMLKFEERDLPLTKAMGLDRRCYLDGMVQPPRICCDTRHGHPATRRAYGEGIKAILGLARKTFGACEIENAVDFASDCIDGISQVKVLKDFSIQNTDFGKYFVDECVPFYQIAYHGILQYRIDMHTKDWEKIYGFADAGLLKAIEFGAMPRAELCYKKNEMVDHTCHVRQLALMKQQYNVLCRELGYLQLEFIEDHRAVTPEVYRTVYSNGDITIVNYSETDFVYDRYTVNAKSYLIIKPS